jgi:dihydroflavonol-4-reductase
MPEMAAILRADLGSAARRVPMRTLPDFLVRALAIVDPTLKSAVPDIGTRPIADSAYVTAMTGVSFRPARDAILASARSLIANGLV